MNRFDCWATHAQAHVFEMQGRFDEGIKFLESTVEDWKVSRSVQNFRTSPILLQSWKMLHDVTCSKATMCSLKFTSKARRMAMNKFCISFCVLPPRTRSSTVDRDCCFACCPSPSCIPPFWNRRY